MQAEYVIKSWGLAETRLDEVYCFEAKKEAV